MKLGRFAILMIGIFVAVVALSWGFFYKYMPDEREVGFLQQNTDLNKAESDKMPQANQRVAKAKALVDKAGNDWQQIVSIKTPPTTVKDGGIDLSQNAFDLTVSWPKFRDNIQRAVNTQVKKGGVTVVNGPNVPLQADISANEILPTVFNFPVLAFPVVIYDFGTVTVQGTYKQIMENVRAYKDMPHYLAVADGLRLDGTSPILTATYNLSIVGFIRTKSIAPPVNEGTASAAGGGSAGGSMFGTGPGGPPGLQIPGAGQGRGRGPGRRGPQSGGAGA